jgi:hypothetical protein
LRDARGTTAFFCFSTQLKPGLSQFKVCGPRHSLLVDQGNGSLIRLRSGSYKSYLTYVVPPLRAALEHFSNAWRNAWSFVRGELYQDFGMRDLIAEFYLGIRSNGNPPIAYREILLTARIMDEIFRQVAAARPPEEPGQKA